MNDRARITWFDRHLGCGMCVDSTGHEIAIHRSYADASTDSSNLDVGTWIEIDRADGALRGFRVVDPGPGYFRGDPKDERSLGAFLVSVFRDTSSISLAELQARGLDNPDKVLRQRMVIALLGEAHLTVMRRNDRFVARPLRGNASAPSAVTYPHEQLLRSVLAGGVRSILLEGPPGCGKTGAGAKVLTELKTQGTLTAVVRYACHGDTEAADLFGGTQLRNGGTFFERGPVLQACDPPRACGLLLDDCDALSVAAAISLFPIIGRTPFQLAGVDEHGRSIHVDPSELVVVGSVNQLSTIDPRFTGQARPNAAWVDRWEAVIRCDYPPPDAEAKLLEGLGVDADLARRMSVFANHARAAVAGDKIGTPVSVRMTLAWARLAAIPQIAPSVAFELAVLNRVYEEDRIPLAEIWRRVCPADGKR